MELEDTDIFEITDYTNVTDWEKFISELEEVLTLVENSQLKQIDNQDLSVKLKFDKSSLNLQLYQPELLNFDGVALIPDDGNNLDVSQVLVTKQGRRTISEQESEIDWQIVKWFGKRKYIVVSPSHQTTIYGQAQIKQLISSLTIAVTNLKCQLPVVLKYGPKNWSLYEGVLLDNDFKGKLQSAVTKYTPKQFNSLSGIRRIFQEKLGKGYVLDDNIIVSAKYLYIVDNCPIRNVSYFNGQFTETKKMHFFQFFSAGFVKDPIKSLRLFAFWTKVSKEVLSQAAQPSLPVSTACSWFLSSVSENSLDGVLYKSLRKLLKSFLVAQKSSELLRDVAIQDAKNINQPLLKLTKSPISNHTFFKSNFVDQLNFTNSSDNSSNMGSASLLDEKVLQEILMYLFPDARTSGEQYQQPYSLKYQNRIPNYAKLKRKNPRANINYFLHRLSICMTNLLTHHKDGLKCFSFVWMEVVLELRFRLENGIALSDSRMLDCYKLINDDACINKDEVYAQLLQDSMPHLGSCQLEQRLQLLNYCILTRLRNQYMQTCDKALTTENSDSDEQFFDCDTETDEMLIEPRGRLRKHESLNLINHPNVPLYVPITQVLPVDILRGSVNSESVQLSHHASLIADMSAFKAANPGCVIEDFIRWYSPNDFLEKDLSDCDVSNISTEISGNTKGSLSFRMQVADNTWLRSWKESSPVPARLQKRLFDETTAAENVLLWLHNLTIAEISSSLINSVLIDSLDVLIECIEDHDSPTLINEIDLAAFSIVQFLDSTDMMDITGAELEYYQAYDKLITGFQRIEYFFAVKRSLYHKFIPDYNGFIGNQGQIIEIINTLIISGGEVGISKKNLTGYNYEYLFARLVSLYHLGNRNSDDTEMVSDLDRIFTHTNQKEYVLSLNSSYPLATSRKSSQRMYICSNDDEFRVATHMFEDLTYF